MDLQAVTEQQVLHKHHIPWNGITPNRRNAPWTNANGIVLFYWQLLKETLVWGRDERMAHPNSASLVCVSWARLGSTSMFPFHYPEVYKQSHQLSSIKADTPVVHDDTDVLQHPIAFGHWQKWVFNTTLNILLLFHCL